MFFNDSAMVLTLGRVTGSDCDRTYRGPCSSYPSGDNRRRQVLGGRKIFCNSTAIINTPMPRGHDRGRLTVMKKSRYGTEGFM